MDKSHSIFVDAHGGSFAKLILVSGALKQTNIIVLMLVTDMMKNNCKHT